ncbi:unnamed protein product [Rhodiola kirilowii]
MNHCIPDWNFEGGLPAANLARQIGPDNELVELLWRNGQVVMHSQTHRKSGASDPNEPKAVHKHDQSSFKGSESCWNPSNLIQDDETVSWLHYPLDDPMENEFGSNLFIELADQVEANKHIKQFENEKMYTKLNPFDVNSVMPSVNQQPVAKYSAGPALTTIRMAPPKFPVPSVPLPSPNNLDLTKHVNLGSSVGNIGTKRTNELSIGDIREGSTMTVGSSHCSSNHIANEVSRTSRNGASNKNISPIVIKNNNNNNRKFVPHRPEGKPGSPDPTMTSSSGGSGSSFMISAGTNSHKRKASNIEESEFQSDAAELELASAKKQSQRSGSSRKTRAAEVHNLSERKRRDRINEKMKALQELIPHSNKADKASMLDEAIEYLKSLQLQLQMMWVGTGMQPMMFPSVQHYLPRMGIGMGPTMPSLHNVMQLPRVPLLDQPMPGTTPPIQANVCPTPVLTPMSYQNQLQNSNLTEQYARYLGFQQMQAASQPVSMFNFGGAQALPSNHSIPLPGTSNGPSAAGATLDNSLGGKSTAG